MREMKARRLLPYRATFLLALGMIGLCACSGARTTPAFTPEQKSAIIKDVQAFTVAMAADVTKRGPAAWRTHFADTPEFFMAAEGQMVFADTGAATKGINDLTGIITSTDLSWKEPIRIDPLTPTLAMVAAPYHQILIDKDGKRVEENGYFTGLAELGPGGWKFRDAHWSLIPPPR